MKINKSYLEQLIIEQIELMENVGGSSFSEPLAKAGALLTRILIWYREGGGPRQRRENPITVSMNDFDSILNPYLNKWITVSLDGDHFCGQLDSFDVSASSFPRLLLNFKNVGYASADNDNEEEYIHPWGEVTINMAPRDSDDSKGYLVLLPASILSLSVSRSSIIITKDGDSNIDLIVSDQPNFKFMEELGPNPSINAGLRFLRDLVAGDGGSEIPTLHPTQVLGIKSVFSKDKSDIILNAFEEYIERGDLNVGLPDYEYYSSSHTF